MAGDEFHLDYIAPHGVLYRYLNDVAWQLAKSHDISSKLDFKTIAILTHIYEDQVKIAKVEEEIARVILSREARKPENVRLTLVLIRDNYKGWAVDRAPGLLQQYDDAIKLLSSEH